MEAKARPIGKILEERTRFCVPVYQRHYEWERKEQWEPLWADIEEKAQEVLENTVKNHSHYLGALILVEGKAKHGQVPIKQVIDGQQRLTTLQVFINALHRIAVRREASTAAAILESHLFNDKPQLMQHPEIEKHKLWPTRYDQAVYADIVDLSFDDLHMKYKEFVFKNGNPVEGRAPRLLSCLHFFCNAIVAFLDEGQSSDWACRLAALSEAVLDHFSIVVISLDEQDDAQTIFSTLNARGKPLSAMDLIRNDIFHRAVATGENAEKLFYERWAEFEEPFWDADDVQGRLTRKRIEYFLANVLAAEKAEVINLQKIYPEYKTYAHTAAFPTVDAEISRLLAYAPAYRGLRQPDTKGPLGKIARHLTDWDSTIAFPFVMSVEKELKGNDGDRQEIYAALESYTVRRAYCGLTNKSYNKSFLAAVQFLRMHGWSSNIFGRFLLMQNGDTTRFPADDEFKSAIMTQPVYKQGWERRVRALLQSLEQALRTTKDDVIAIQAGFTVEHVLPVRWAEHWPLPNGHSVPSEDVYGASAEYKLDPAITEAVRLRETLKHTLGNLTLITQPLNAAIGNGPFTLKREKLSRSALVLNRMICRRPVWNEEEIESRGLLLAERAACLWIRPNLEMNESQ